MSPPSRTLLLAALLAFPAAPVSGVTLRIQNLQGAVKTRIVLDDRIQLRHTSPDRDPREDDTLLTRENDLVRIEAQPGDGARVDLEVDVPFGIPLQIRTREGGISIRGMVAYAEISTENGNLHLETPWEATRLYLLAEKRPVEVNSPDSLKFVERKVVDNDGKRRWLLRDGNPDLRVTYGHIRVRSTRPGRVVLRNTPIPEEAPVRLPWQAPAVLGSILSGKDQAKEPVQNSPESPPKEQAPASGAEQPLFSSEVRLVNLSVTVYDREGRPLTDLQPEDFEIYEDGVLQTVTFAGSEEVPFNLAILLDMSVSTKGKRDAVQEAARRFTGIARPQDRVALYALAGDLFRVVSTLTDDHAKLLRIVDSLPEVAGATPLYDSIVHSYAYELVSRTNERNALIVLSDGLDNQIFGVGVPSEVPFKKLRDAAEELGVLTYPVFLNPENRRGERVARTARERLEDLAAASGGKLFPADSAQDLEPVYPQVAEELRSVYSLGYYPANQEFEGAWRSVEVRVKQPGARVRARSGYRAW